MNLRSRLWVLIPVCALAFIGWLDLRRARHVVAVTALGGWAGRTAEGRALIVPEHIAPSYHWLAQTDLMIERHEWRIRRIGYENAPYGRDVANASPYRWWLGALAWVDHVVSGRPMPAAVERAALVADPLLDVIILLATAAFVAWRFGALAAALSCVGLALLFPLAAAFLPGAPDDTGIVAALSLFSVLLLGAGVMTESGKAAVGTGNDEGAGREARSRAAKAWFVLAGLVAGCGLWLNPAHEIAVLVGIGVAALGAAWIRARSAGGLAYPSLPWRSWALAGGTTTLVAYLIEYFPDHLGGWQLRAVHPLYGLAWIGAGELLAQATTRLEHRSIKLRWRSILALAGAGLAVAALPVAMWRLHERGIFTVDLPEFRLTKLPGSPLAPSFTQWIATSGAAGTALTILLPLLLVVPAGWWMLRRAAGIPARTFVALALGPVVVTAIVGFRVLIWWNAVDAVAIALLVAISVAVTATAGNRSLWSVMAVGICLPGVLLLGVRNNASNAPTQPEVFGLIDRDLADWLSQHAPSGRAVFIAPPAQTTALSYYGAGDGIATLSWQNKAGLEAAVRILSASTPEEAKTLIDRRGITHLIMPSWDPYLDEYARMGMGELDGTFLNRIHQWKIPNWLRPMPYRLPIIPGFEQQTVTLFAVVDDQSDALALSRTAEYFIELGQLDPATAVGQALRRYPADMNAWIARAEVETATNDQEDLAKSLNVLLPYVKGKRDRRLPWDLRVGLAVVLARAKEQDLARAQVDRCLEEISADKIRALPTGNLYRLLVLARAFNRPIADAKLHALALALLPADARSRLER